MMDKKLESDSSNLSNRKGIFAWMSDITPEQWKIFGVTFSGWTFGAMNILFFTFAAVSIADVFSLSPQAIGGIFSVMLFSSAFGGIFFGIVSDYIGRVRAITLTILFYSFFTGLIAFSPNITFLIVCSIFLGIGMGGQWSSGQVFAAESWPRQHRGKIIGMVQSGWAVGYILAAILATLILSYFEVSIGWRILFLIGILPVFLVFYIRRNLSEPKIWRRASRMRKEKRLEASGQEFTLNQIFKGELLRYTVLCTLFTSLCMLAYWGLTFWIPQFLARPIEDGGIGLGLRGFIWIVPLNLGAFLGLNSFGWISDKFGRRPVFASFLFILAILIYFFGQSTTFTQILILGPLVGFFGAGFYSGFGAMFSELFPTRARATAQGFCYNVGRGVGAFAPPLVGYVAEVKGYGPALVTVSVFALAAAFVVFALPETKGKKLDI
ncbi:MAG: MFS transporter [Candidatus Dadabacteria bacterium]|nr:MFS transporter [Candidatus Dadabacteria bacterium]